MNRYLLWQTYYIVELKDKELVLKKKIWIAEELDSAQF